MSARVMSCKSTCRTIRYRPQATRPTSSTRSPLPSPMPIGRFLDAHPVEVLTWTITGTVEAGSDSGALPFQSAQGDAEPIGVTRLYDPDAGAVVDAPIYWRDSLPNAFVVEGPAVITEEETSTVVSSRFLASVNPLGHLVLTVKNATPVASE